MFRIRHCRGLFTAASLIAAGTLLTATPANAATPRVTRGEAIAVFQAALNGGRAMVNHSPVSLGAPSDLDRRATIRPLIGEGFDGMHYCAEDWHVILLADVGGGDRSYRRQDFDVFTAHDVIVLRLDGGELPTTRTATKHVNNPLPPDEIEFGFQQGRVMAPEELSVGAHSLDATLTFPPDTIELHITFFIDAPGTGVCVA